MNPYNKDWTAGGSTGGDACIVKLGQANIAIGSDVGGSIWIPA